MKERTLRQKTADAVRRMTLGNFRLNGARAFCRRPQHPL